MHFLENLHLPKIKIYKKIRLLFKNSVQNFNFADYLLIFGNDQVKNFFEL